MTERLTTKTAEQIAEEARKLQIKKLTPGEIHILALVGLELMEETVFKGVCLSRMDLDEFGQFIDYKAYEIADRYGSKMRDEFQQCFNRAGLRLVELTEDEQEFLDSIENREGE